MNTRWPLSILVLSTTVLASAVIPIGAQPPPGAVRGPAHGDAGVSDFYAWKEKVPRVPGRLLRQEPLPDQLMLTNAAKGLRVLYTSTDGIDGKSPIAVSGAIYPPKGTPPAGGWPIVAWAHGTTGTADVCAPSWMERGTRDTDYLNAWLGQGYAVVASDYQGLGTPGGHPGWRCGRRAGACSTACGRRSGRFRNWRTRSSSSDSRRGRMPRCPLRGWPRATRRL